MKIEELYEAPQQVADTEFNLYNDEANKSVYNQIKSDKRSKIILSIAKDINLYESGNKYALLNENSQRVIYYMEYKFNFNKFTNTNSSQQFILWRDIGAIASKNIAEKIFFEFLLTKTGSIVTDYQQTDNGEKFWLNRIADAIAKKNLFVYFISLVPERFIKQIKTEDELRECRTEIWGFGEKYKAKRIIISNHEIK